MRLPGAGNTARPADGTVDVATVAALEKAIEDLKEAASSSPSSDAESPATETPTPSRQAS